MKLTMRTRWVIAAMSILIGAVWLGQGAGLFNGSGPMDGSAFWAVVGAGLVVLGLVLAWTTFRARSKA